MRIQAGDKLKQGKLKPGTQAAQPPGCVTKPKSVPKCTLSTPALPQGPSGRRPPTMQVLQETQARSPGREDPLQEGTATRSSILAWGIPWTGEPGGLQSTGSPRVRQE